MATATNNAAVPPLEGQTRWIKSGRASLVARGGAWSIAGYAITQLLRTATTLVLAKYFLSPEQFGVIGLVTVFLSGLTMFSELGIVTAIVQNPAGDTPRFLGTAFSIQAIRGVCIWIVALIAAYPLSLFYQQPALFPLLAVVSFSEVIRGVISTSAWELNRQVKLRKITLLTIASEFIAFAVSILWALVSPTAWVLVAKTIAGALVLTVGSHFLTERRDQFLWDRTAVNQILHFGGWISISTAAHFMGSQGERLLLGKFLTPAELGCFSLALMISLLPAAGMGQVVNQILLPVLSTTVRENNRNIGQDFRRVRRLFFFVALFAASGFLILSKPLVDTLLPVRFSMTGWMLQLLGIRVALDVFAAPVSCLILAYGKPRYAAAANTTRVIFMVFGVWIAMATSGLRYAILALVIAQAISYFPLIVGVRGILPEVTRIEARWYFLLLALLATAALLLR